MSSFTQQLEKMKTHPGFIAALDQSGGSTPKALTSYGIKEGAWSNEEEMFAIVHQMRTRIITSPSFTGERILSKRALIHFSCTGKGMPICTAQCNASRHWANGPGWSSTRQPRRLCWKKSCKMSTRCW